MATLAAKAGPNLIIAPVCCTLCCASAVVATVFSVMCSKDIKSTAKNTVRDCSVTGAMWCLCVLAFLVYAYAAVNGLSNMMST